MNTHRIMNNFCSSPEIYADLKAAIPPIEQVPHTGRSHRDLYWTDDAFIKLRENESWKYLLTSINTPEWWVQNFHDWLYCKTQDNVCIDLLTKIPFKTPDEYIEPRSGRILPSSSDEPPFLYARIDIGYGLEGYGELNGGGGVHIDFPQRIISILYYFTDQSELEGGEFEVHNSPTSGAIGVIPLKENMAIAMLQDQHGWHAVTPVRELLSGKPRIAAYISLSCSQKIWKYR